MDGRSPQAFVVGQNGGVYTSTLGGSGTMSPWNRLDGIEATPGSKIAAVESRFGYGSVILYVITRNGRLSSCRTQGSTPKTSWHDLPISGYLHGSDLAFVSRFQGHVDWFLAARKMPVPVVTGAYYKWKDYGPWPLSGVSVGANAFENSIGTGTSCRGHCCSIHLG